MNDITEELRAPYWDDGTPHALLMVAAAEIERNRKAIAELVSALDSLCLRIDNEGASPMDWDEYDSACTVLEKHSTTKETE